MLSREAVLEAVRKTWQQDGPETDSWFEALTDAIMALLPKEFELWEYWNKEGKRTANTPEGAIFGVGPEALGRAAAEMTKSYPTQLWKLREPEHYAEIGRAILEALEKTSVEGAEGL